MRRAALLLLVGLCIASPALAAKLNVLGVYHVDANTDAQMAKASTFWVQELESMAASLNIQFFWQQDRQHTNPPLIAYTQGIGSYFGRPGTTFDGLVIIGDDPSATCGNCARFDSVSKAGKYPTIPTLFYGMKFCPTTNDSMGWLTGSISKPQPGAMSVEGTNVRLQTGNFVARGGVYNPLPDGSMTAVVTGSATDDTAYVTHRAAGAGITWCQVANDSTEARNRRALAYRFLAVLRWLRDFPAAKQPRLDIPIALMIDDGWRFHGYYRSQHQAATSAYMDSLAERRVKWSVGVTTDSVWAYLGTELPVYDRGKDLVKFFPHTHSRDGGSFFGTYVQHANTNTVPTDLYGIIGVRPNCDADPVGTMADTLSVYAALKTATDTLATYFGADRIDHVIAGPGDDYSPMDMGQPGQCTIDRLLDAIRHAGFVGIRINSGSSMYPPQSALTNSSYGYNSYATTYRTKHGDIRILGEVGGTFMPSGLDSVNSASWPHTATSALINSTLGLTRNSSQAGTGPKGITPANIIVQHHDNYKLSPAANGDVGWRVIKEICNLMDACNYIYGSPIWRWVWSEELGPDSAPSRL